MLVSPSWDASSPITLIGEASLRNAMSLFETTRIVPEASEAPLFAVEAKPKLL